ncbi:MAG: PH domain-containing protein [Nostocoides sp.]
MASAGEIVVASQVRKQLAAGETVLVQLHQHPMVLVRPVARAVLATVVWWFLIVDISRPSDLTFFLGWIVLGMWLWVGWCEIERRNNWIVVTEKRIFQTEGIFTRTVPMMRLSKVTDVTYRRNVAGRLFRYGLIIIESAGQDQALHDLNFIPYPEGTDALKATLFGERPRDRDGDPGRWKPLLRKGRGRGTGRDDGPGPSSGPGSSGGGGEPSGGTGPSSGTGGSDTPHLHGGSGGYLTPFEDDPAYEPVDPTDVPPAGYRSSPATATADPDTGGITIYRSADRHRLRIGEEDTGPIPITQRPRPERRRRP